MRAPRAWLACLVLLPTLACQADDGGRDRDGPREPSGSTSAPAGMDESLRDAALALVETRERALQEGDRDAFLATVDPEAEEFAETQARWFDNLAELPATDISLELGDEDVMTRIAGAGDLQLPIDFTMKLAGYDEHATTQPLVYTFVGDEEEVLLASDRNLQSDAFTGWLPAPWDVTAISVVESDGVLAVFDDSTRDEADEVLADIVEARDDIEPFLPAWSGRVVIYDISDLEAIDRMSLMEVDDTAGIAFPVLTRPGSKKVAAYRFTLNPAHAGAGLERRILVRHELVHVALAVRDDDSPTWLVEGAAEYVARAAEWDTSVRRAIFTRSLEGRPAAPLATGRDFYQVRPGLNYELAALACDYLASTQGNDVLWDLMRTFRREQAYLPGDVEGVVQAELGMSTREITTRALAWVRG